MSKMIFSTSMLLILLLGLVACSNENPPKEPTADDVIRDIEASASNILLGDARGQDEKFLLSPLIVDEWDVQFTKTKKELTAEITAIVGDKLWVSSAKKTITVQYRLNESKQWTVQGVNVNDPVIRVEPRTN
ncbi:MAG: hypothetical protein ACE3L7_12685 [Candidatus Pristimantibacillus sp.]